MSKLIKLLSYASVLLSLASQRAIATPFQDAEHQGGSLPAAEGLPPMVTGGIPKELSTSTFGMTLRVPFDSLTSKELFQEINGTRVKVGFVSCQGPTPRGRVVGVLTLEAGIYTPSNVRPVYYFDSYDSCMDAIDLMEKSRSAIFTLGHSFLWGNQVENLEAR